MLSTGMVEHSALLSRIDTSQKQSRYRSAGVAAFWSVVSGAGKPIAPEGLAGEAIFRARIMKS
jgi:hypothetical protein